MGEQFRKKKLLIFEEDAELLAKYHKLFHGKFKIEAQSNFTAWDCAIRDFSPDIIVSELQLQSMRFSNQLKRNAHKSIPMVIVSKFDDYEQINFLLQLDSVSYISKPFGENELLAKIDHALKSKQKPFLNIRSLSLAYLGKTSEQLTTKEFQILDILLDAPHYELTREEIQQNAWSGLKITGHTLDVHMFNLRKKIAKTNISIAFKPTNSFVLEIPQEP